MLGVYVALVVVHFVFVLISVPSSVLTARQIVAGHRNAPKNLTNSNNCSVHRQLYGHLSTWPNHPKYFWICCATKVMHVAAQETWISVCVP